MQQIAIRLSTWSDDRFASLLEASGWQRPYALGALTMLWAGTRTLPEGPYLSDAEIRCALAPLGGDVDKAVAYLVWAGYLDSRGAPDNKIKVVDNEHHYALKKKLRDAGARGGYQKHRARTPKKAAARTKKDPSQTALVWQAYSQAFFRRYQVKPVSNVMVMGQLARLVSLVGVDAPDLATFYVGHDNAYYVRCQHSVGVLLKDYSSLHTQMHRNVTVTEHDVTAHSRGSELQTQLRRFGCR